MTPTAQVIHQMRHQQARPDALPLRWAGLCPQDETIYDSRLACPYCGGREAVILHRVLGVAA